MPMIGGPAATSARVVLGRSAAIPSRLTPGLTSPALSSVTSWKAKFDAQKSTSDAQLTALATADSKLHYTLAYYIDGYTMMWLATGDSTYADLALGAAETIAANSAISSSFPTSVWQDGYQAWISFADGQQGRETSLFEVYCWRHIARLVYECKTRGVYTSRANTVLAFLETNIFDKWYSRGTSTNVYRGRTHLASHWALISRYLVAMDTAPTRKAQAQVVADNIDDLLPGYSYGLRTNLRLTPEGGFTWSDTWDTAPTAQPADMSHSNGEVDYIVAAFDTFGTRWGRGDIHRLIRTLYRAWHAPFVDGSGLLGRDLPNQAGMGAVDFFISNGWAKLGRFDPALQRYMEPIPTGDMIIPAQHYGAMALNAARLGA